jgi:hypothetical protein
MVDQHKLNLDRKRPSTLPQDGRSEVAVDDQNEGDDLDIPAYLDRRAPADANGGAHG